MRAHQKPIESVAELKALLDRLPPGAEANFGVVHDEDSEQLFSEDGATGRSRLNADLQSLLAIMDNKQGAQRQELSVDSETLRSHLSALELSALPHSLRPTLGADPGLQLAGPFSECQRRCCRPAPFKASIQSSQSSPPMTVTVS